MHQFSTSMTGGKSDLTPFSALICKTALSDSSGGSLAKKLEPRDVRVAGRPLEVHPQVLWTLKKKGSQWG